MNTRHEKGHAMTTVLLPTVEALQAERSALVSQSHLGEAELRRRAEIFMLTPEEARLLRRLEEIDFLLELD
jgi:hypothetical protein